MRLGFTRGVLAGAATAGIATLTGGRIPARRISVRPDAGRTRRISTHEPLIPDGTLTFSKLDANFRSGNQTRDDIPLHVIPAENVPPHVAEFYAAMCPAGVYEQRNGKLIINAPNCIDCRATDVLGPRWTPREGGSGPKYHLM
jgi:electron-transferring-flavoprotein dehydrogenase